MRGSSRSSSSFSGLTERFPAIAALQLPWAVCVTYGSHTGEDGCGLCSDVRPCAGHYKLFSEGPGRAVAFCRKLWLDWSPCPKRACQQNGAVETKGLLCTQVWDFSVLRSGLPLVSCKSAVAMPSVKVVYTRRGPSTGYFSCTCHLEACNKFYGPGFIEHGGRGIEVACLNVRLMFWRKQARSDERFDRSQPTFWGKSNGRVPSPHLPQGTESPGASRPPPSPCLSRATSVSSPTRLF